MTFASTYSLESIRSTCMRRLRKHGCMRRGGMTRLRTSRLITKRDQQRRNVLAVLCSFGKRRTGAVTLDPILRQIDTHRMRFRIAGSNDATGAHLANVDVFDDATSKVLEPP